MVQALLIPPLARAALDRHELDTFISLLFSPFLAIGSLTTFVVGFNSFVALATGAGAPGVLQRIEEAIGYGTARAFVVAIAPAGFLLYCTIRAYT